VRNTLLHISIYERKGVELKSAELGEGGLEVVGLGEIFTGASAHLAHGRLTQALL